MCAHSVATNTSCASVQFWPVAHHVEKQENSYLLHACKNYCWLGFVVVAAVLFGVFLPDLWPFGDVLFVGCFCYSRKNVSL